MLCSHNSDKSNCINLKETETNITGQTLNELGMKINRPAFRNCFFTIIKMKTTSSTYYLIRNNCNKCIKLNIYVVSDSNYRNILVDPYKQFQIKNLLKTKISLDFFEESYGFLYFVTEAIDEALSIDNIRNNNN